MGSGLPQGAVGGSVTRLTTGAKPWNFVFQNSSSLWVADSTAPSTAHFSNWAPTSGGGAWSAGVAVRLGSNSDPVYSLAGRFEGGVGSFVIYAVTAPDSDASTVWRYITETNAAVSTIVYIYVHVHGDECGGEYDWGVYIHARVLVRIHVYVYKYIYVRVCTCR